MASLGLVSALMQMTLLLIFFIIPNGPDSPSALTSLDTPDFDAMPVYHSLSVTLLGREESRL